MIDTQPMDGAGIEQGESFDNQSGTENQMQDADSSGQTGNKAANDNTGNLFSNGTFWILMMAIVVVLAAIGAGYVLFRKKNNQSKRED